MVCALMNLLINNKNRKLKTIKISFFDFFRFPNSTVELVDGEMCNVRAFPLCTIPLTSLGCLLLKYISNHFMIKNITSSNKKIIFPRLS